MLKVAANRRRICLVRGPILAVGCLMLVAFVADLSGSTGFGKLHGTLLGVGLLCIGLGWRIDTARLAKINLALITLGLLVGVVEVVLRFSMPIPGPGAGEWAGSPGSERVLISAPDQFRAVHRYNSLGFRGPEVSLQRTSPQRIVCIGDSWTEGVGAQEAESWPAVLQRELPGDMVDVVNLGDSGSQPDRYLEILARVGIPLQPTAVIVCVIPSDFIGGPEIPDNLLIHDQVPDAFRNRGSPLRNSVAWTFPGWVYLWDRAHGRWNNRPGLFWDRFDPRADGLMVDAVARRERVSRHRARQLVSERLKTISPECLQSAQIGEFNGARIALEVVIPQASFASRVSDMGIGADDLTGATRAWMKWYADACRSRGIEPYLLFFPEPGLVSDSPAGPVTDANLAGRPSLIHDQSLSDLLAAVCHDAGVTYLDCTPTLRAYVGPEALFLRYDHHPTAVAYRIAGKFVAKAIRDGQVQGRK